MPDSGLSEEQYRSYVELVKQTGRQRSVSLYFFLSANLAIVLVGVALLSTSHVHLAFTIVAGIGIVLCFYWFLEMRETYVLEEVRLRTLIEIETRIFKRGILSEEWNELGQYRFRRSPVFYVAFARYLPLLFALAHVGEMVAVIVRVL